jgi:hypothetical protein
MTSKFTGRVTNSVDIKYGRYSQGGSTERLQYRLGWWTQRNIPTSVDDIIYIIAKGVEKRPDLISNHVYGTPIYAWLVLQYNNIVDIETELVSDVVIKLPTRSRLILQILGTGQ